MANHNSFIVDVDLRSHENNLAHRTREIDRERLIVRRGQPFFITVQCSDPLPPNHQLELVLHLGKQEDVVFKVQRQGGGRDRWRFDEQEVQGEILLTLHSPADAIIGHYRLTVLLMSPDGHIVEKLDKISFHLLFNPWCKDDAVYMSDERLLKEYIMNEDGVIYMGTSDYIRGIPWNYGQFEDFVMDICFEVLDNSKDALKNSKKDIENRCDPVYVSRIITAMVNANGDRGVLIGKWSSPYLDGVAPSRWTGSVPILRQWSKAGSRAVKYGQCWVFAGVACTVLRCLGIPTRLITNFSSAHDVDGNLSIDFVEDFESREERKDSTWNFHCWVESWMRRNDLPKGNDGWQVLDPTPQELSDGEFCCGPCPVSAIKEGNLEMKYDAPFVFAEVNADIIYWRVLPGGRKQKISVDQRTVGRNISTKSVYGDIREDVTLYYKYPEGSKEEREVYKKAGRRLTPSNDECKPSAQLNMLIKHPNPVFGTDFDVIVEVKNKGCEDANVQLAVRAIAVTYNSLHQGECKRQTNSVTVLAQNAHKEVLRFRYEDYAKYVAEHNLIRVKALVDAEGDSLPIMAVADIPLSMPELHIQVLGKAFVLEQLTAYISFTNPLPVPLTGGVFTLEGAGLLSDTQIYVDGVISPGQKVSVKITFTPMRTGIRKLLVDFDSDRLKDVKGVTSMVVRKRYRNMTPLLYGRF
ncbi:PREDICTED: protein-glutamine gamma-glutamyltransferase 2-like [Cyprinodon variegatus]|uniref:protein-glutamine gamma-glutamyltransferase n=1 Tax=Cyprinodon variegatus TaxID=28743 RepID=A0A3Q2CZ39_CYPVA|nr:PREDICTED: protein-glutamine gamma-glutamyltransferase 2-like [Cyprinodon variegatus]